jgi:hypothetical protein
VCRRFRYSYDSDFPKGEGSWAFPGSFSGFPKTGMILEDLQHQYEGLKQRIDTVRSYL